MTVCQLTAVIFLKSTKSTVVSASLHWLNEAVDRYLQQAQPCALTGWMQRAPTLVRSSDLGATQLLR